MALLMSEMTCEGRNAIHQGQKQTNKNKVLKQTMKQQQRPKTQ